MGAAAVLLFPDGQIVTDACKVDGDPSSFRAEAAGMHLTLALTPMDQPVTIFTDSMNVVFALQAFNTGEFARDMRRQLHADIIKQILLAINLRSAPTTIVKVKSHRGIALNEMADQAAGWARLAPPEEVDTRYCGYDYFREGLAFEWRASEDDEEPTITRDPKQVFKRWQAQARAMQVAAARIADT